MTWPIVRAVAVAVIATLTLAGVVQLAPTQRPLAVAVYLLVMAAVTCLLYTSPSPRDRQKSRMPSSA